jgi:hypothetical protein
VGAIESEPPPDMGTVLLSQGGTQHYRTAPMVRAVEPLAVVNLGCEKHPIYHGGGLLPGMIDRKTRVLTPEVYAPPGKWAVRLTSYLEVLLLKDVSKTLSKVLVEFPPASDQILRAFLPGKCLVLGFRALFRDWNGGGQMFGRMIGRMKSVEGILAVLASQLVQMCCTTGESHPKPLA